ncbi:GNAT family N-acetyltransferase [Haloquadratum walsbyi]|jgi:N-acetylglutamate synthase and related acetyltransferases|uniref:N-acetylglutamate synthase related acetyltransferase n=1 Tax=Haloquadratum walsbyi J07HQW2 TaxID=1238425 RepID=U1PM96_9EURY|nr:GNAT family N-acetyltransferase [Haloquadratum walsbyi]ERG94832.1 MAG: N-acetylglutamate synthase related acetyltransferase [Haloquadratum walsbyi J07HQW2]
MYVRDAKNRDEAWLLDWIEEAEIGDPAFRSRDYVIALNEETSRKAGFGRIRSHSDDDETFCELALVFTLPVWRNQGVGAHVIERLVAEAADEQHETVHVFTTDPGYFTMFGFKPQESAQLDSHIKTRFRTARENRESDDDQLVALSINTDELSIPQQMRERFKQARPSDEPAEGEVVIEETAEDFGIDPTETTYKYDTG